MRFDVRHFLIVVLAACVGCVSKGDVNVKGKNEGEAPTCANVCGAVTANNANFCGCGAYVPKTDRQLCITQCEALAPTEDELRCTASAHDCGEIEACGQFWPASQVVGTMPSCD